MGFSINCIEILISDEKVLKESSYLYKNLYTESDLRESKKILLNDYYYEDSETLELRKNEKRLASDLFFDGKYKHSTYCWKEWFWEKYINGFNVWSY